MKPHKRVQYYVPCPAKHTTMAPPNRTDSIQGTVQEEFSFLPVRWCILKYGCNSFFFFCGGEGEEDMDVSVNAQFSGLK